MLIDQVNIGNDFPDEFNAIIEIPMGANAVKYEIDKNSGALSVDRIVKTAMFYPFHYGFVPHTLAEDGDPVDVLLYADFPLIPASVIKVRPIGMLNMEDESGKDQKILCVPVSSVDDTYDNINEYNELSANILKKTEHFFNHYKDLEPKKWVKTDGFENKKLAKQYISDKIVK